MDHSATDLPIILAQEAAGFPYEQMLIETDALHRAFCHLNDIEFRSFVGVRRGWHPWQASFNRIELLHELLNDGFEGWFVHLDADAVIRSPRFDLRRYLGKRVGSALIASPSGAGMGRWDINDGVFFLNLGHDVGRQIARRWWESFHDSVSDDMLRAAAAPWQPLPDGRPFPDDQHLLQMLLRLNEELSSALLLDETGTFNFGSGKFIKQMMRSAGTFEERLENIKKVAELARADLSQF